MIKFNAEYKEDEIVDATGNAYFVRSRKSVPVPTSVISGRISTDLTTNSIVIDKGISSELEAQYPPYPIAIDKASQSHHFRVVQKTAIIAVEIYMGKVESVECGEAHIQLQDEAGREFYGCRKLTDFDGLNLCKGDYFYCAVQTRMDGSIEYKFSEAKRKMLDQETIDYIDRQVEAMLG